jgi:hypothetical protein
VSLLSFTKYLALDDHRWLVGRGELVNPDPAHDRPEPVRTADDPDTSWLTADGKAFDPPDDVAIDIRGLPPARVRLAQFVAWRRLVAERLANLQSGIDRLCADITRVTEAKDRQRALKAADTSSMLDNLRQGAEATLSAISERQAQDLAAQLAASEHQAAVSDEAVKAATPERDHFKVALAALDERLSGVMTEALVEQAEASLSGELAAAEQHLRDVKARIWAATDNWRPTIEIPICRDDVAKHRPAWKRLAEVWAKDPRAAPSKYLKLAGK